MSVSTKAGAAAGDGRVLPPGLSAREFERALERFARELTPERVLSTPESMTEFRDPFSYRTWDDKAAAAVVLPQSVEEIQAVLAIARECRIPLWTHSTGRNNGYGGPGPRLRGCVILSLRGMNRVLEIDPTLGYAVVEPGVRWFDLYNAIQEAGLDLMVSVADLGWGGPVGNTLENGITYLPYAVDWNVHCGMEVVLANGDVMRTGMGAMPGNRAWNVYRRGLGPSVDPLFLQSNYGIVTKMGIWLMPRPEVYMPMWLRVWRDDDIAALLDTLRELALDDTIRMIPTILNTLNMAAVRTSRADWYEGEGPVPEPVIDRIAKELEIGRWMMRCALYGDAAVVDHRFAKVKAAFERIPGCDIRGTRFTREEFETIEAPGEKIMAGIPNMAWDHITRWAGGTTGGHIGFSPVVPMTGEDALRVRDLLRGLVEGAGLDYLAGLLPVNGRSFIHIAMLMFDTDNESQTRRAYDVAKRMVVEAAEHGFGEYRAHVDFMDEAARQYSFGDHAYMRFCERIKDALDPDGILSPGKNGIWPQHMRDTPA